LHPGGQPITVSDEHLSAGAEVTLAVRPEAVELSALSEGTGQNAYKAGVRSVSFLGDHYLYELDIDGMPLTVTDTRSFPGPSVTVRIPPSACRVLPP
jgi:ABC-type Fe3+/spermidine/putrescine transport system ATPase subunit